MNMLVLPLVSMATDTYTGISINPTQILAVYQRKDDPTRTSIRMNRDVWEVVNMKYDDVIDLINDSFDKAPKH